ncbi:MAG: competence/damage-inducible protein A [Rhodospirillaceae bacterium]|nr:competence/damage-inducible protein A [Rhodospirillaceae bacterium]
MSDTSNTVVTAAFLIIGNEILSGRTKDLNLNVLATALVEKGIRMREARVVADDEDEIVGAVQALSKRYDHVFTSGGIGPTHDDISCDCIAKAFGRPVIRNPGALRLLQVHYERSGIELNEARLRMANTPEGATLIDNPVSAAPGFTIENVHVMAGVPRIFEAMVKELLPRLVGGAPVRSISISCPLGEGIVAAGLGAIQAEHPDLEVGSYPYFRAGKIGTTLVARGSDDADLEAAAEKIRALIRQNGGEPIEV